MYSKELQERFLRDIHANATEASGYQLMFREVVVPLEQQYQTDFYDLPPSQIVALLQTRDYYTISTARKIVTKINTFRRWYGSVMRGEFRAVPELQIADLSLTETYQKMLFFTPEELVECTSVQPVEDGFLDQPIAALLWLGFDAKELTSIREEEVVAQKKKLLVRGVPVENESLRRVLTEYQKRTVFQRGAQEVCKGDGEAFLRPIGFRSSARLNKPLAADYPQRVFVNHAQFYARPISPNIIHKSAELYRLYRMAEQDLSTANVQRIIGAKSSRTALDVQLELRFYAEAVQARAAE